MRPCVGDLPLIHLRATASRSRHDTAEPPCGPLERRLPQTWGAPEIKCIATFCELRERSTRACADGPQHTCSEHDCFCNLLRAPCALQATRRTGAGGAKLYPLQQPVGRVSAPSDHPKMAEVAYLQKMILFASFCEHPVRSQQRGECGQMCEMVLFAAFYEPRMPD